MKYNEGESKKNGSLLKEAMAKSAASELGITCTDPVSRKTKKTLLDPENWAESIVSAQERTYTDLPVSQEMEYQKYRVRRKRIESLKFQVRNKRLITLLPFLKKHA